MELNKNTPFFIDEYFLLQNKTAQYLFHDFAKDMPIIDYHNHINPDSIAQDNPLNNITDVWLSADHYKWRAMRANGIQEKFITGRASKEEKFHAWAKTVPYTVRNPLFHWSHLELKQYFGIEEHLQEYNASVIYKKCNEQLGNISATKFLKQAKVEVICTTDDPCDDLVSHKINNKKSGALMMRPTFRSDQLLDTKRPSYLKYLDLLSEKSAIDITDITSLLKAIQTRVDYFHEIGCRLSDYGLSGSFTYVSYDLREVDRDFKTYLLERDRSKLKVQEFLERLRPCIAHELGKMYHAKGWVQQYHLGPIRNNNSRLVNLVGADVGCDSMGDYQFCESLSRFFDDLDKEGKLAKTIAYNNNPSNNEMLATMLANYNDGETIGKMQFGAAWWFMDQKRGIERQLNDLSDLGLLSRFIGFLTDSRSVLSFSRHDYFRRILCNIVGKDIEEGLLPNDRAFFGKLVQDISYNNAKNYFNFDER